MASANGEKGRDGVSFPPRQPPFIYTREEEDDNQEHARLLPPPQLPPPPYPFVSEAAEASIAANDNDYIVCVPREDSIGVPREENRVPEERIQEDEECGVIACLFGKKNGNLNLWSMSRCLIILTVILGAVMGFGIYKAVTDIPYNGTTCVYYVNLDTNHAEKEGSTHWIYHIKELIGTSAEEIHTSLWPRLRAKEYAGTERKGNELKNVPILYAPIPKTNQSCGPRSAPKDFVLENLTGIVLNFWFSEYWFYVIICGILLLLLWTQFLISSIRHRHRLCQENKNRAENEHDRDSENGHVQDSENGHVRDSENNRNKNSCCNMACNILICICAIADGIR